MNLLKFFNPKEVYVCPDWDKIYDIVSKPFPIIGVTKKARKVLKEKPCPCCRKGEK
jgi:hypothetical protein